MRHIKGAACLLNELFNIFARIEDCFLSSVERTRMDLNLLLPVRQN